MGRILFFLREFSVPLVAGVISALVWVNVSPQSYHAAMKYKFFFGHHLNFIVNDIFMAFFFAIVGIQIIESLLPGGELNPARKAINPLFATLGGVIGPIVVYLGLNSIFGSSELVKGWGIPTATDIALAWLVARFIFGEAHPAVKFLLLLAITDDAIGLAIIAIFYPDPLYPIRPMWFSLVLVGIGVAYFLRKMRIGNYWVYLLTSGLLSWAGLYQSGLHPALALVFIVPFIPLLLRQFKNSSIAKFEREWSGFVDFGLFLFGLTNAGVEFSGIGTVTWLVFFSLIIGKTLGIYLFANLAILAGFPLPNGMGQKEVLVLGLNAAVGLTVALFVASGAFTQAELQSSAKMGALLSVNAAIIAFILSRVLHVKKFHRRR